MEGGQGGQAWHGESDCCSQKLGHGNGERKSKENILDLIDNRSDLHQRFPMIGATQVTDNHFLSHLLPRPHLPGCYIQVDTTIYHIQVDTITNYILYHTQVDTIVNYIIYYIQADTIIFRLY